MPPKRTPSPMPARSKLWKEAYEALEADPDEREVMNSFYSLVKKGSPNLPDLDTDAGRRHMLNIIEKKNDSLQASSSPEMKRACKVANKARNLISLGAAANPCATVAVAGFFIAFDLIQMHQAEKEAIFEITVETADIMCCSALHDHQVNKKQDKEPQELRDARQRLRGAYVQLYRTILYLSMKIAYKVTGWRKYFVGWSAWREEEQNLQKAENRVNKFLRPIHEYETNPPSKAPNWKRPDKNETRLHRLVKDGRANDVYNMIEAGECPKDLLNSKTSKQWTALMLSVKGGHWKIMNYLLRVSGIWTNAKNTDGNTALILAAQNNRPGFTKKLLENGAKYDVRNNGQRTAFLEAAMRGNLGVMKVLEGKGDDINQVTGKNGWCALHTATDKNYLEMAQWLLEKRAKRYIKIKGGKREGKTPKALAAELGRAEILAILP